MTDFHIGPPQRARLQAHNAEPTPLPDKKAAASRLPVMAGKVVACSLLAAAGFGLLHYGRDRNPGPAVTAAMGRQAMAASAPAQNKSFFWRKDLTHLVINKDEGQVKMLLGPPDGIFKHGDGRQIWFYYRLSADRHTRRVDGLTVLKISPDGRINRIAFRQDG